jgi:SAM-dependent methyltransferase
MDECVVDACEHRTPYPGEALERLLGLIRDQPRIVLDLGCGLGEIARRIAPHVDRVHAVDASPRMIDRARSLPGADARSIHWLAVPAESFSFAARYALVVAADSFLWLDWAPVMRRIAWGLSPSGTLALLDRHHGQTPWYPDLVRLIERFSVHRDYRRCDVLGELTERRLLSVAGVHTTAPVFYRQRLGSYVESWHSRPGLSRERMEQEQAREFDCHMTELLAPHSRHGYLEFPVTVRIAWGQPA